MFTLRTLRILAIMCGLFILAAASSCANRSSRQVASPPTLRTQAVGLGQHASFGPYEITISRSRLLSRAKPWHLLAVIDVQVRNPSEQATAPVPPTLAFRLIDDHGRDIKAQGGGLTRTRPPKPGNPHSSGLGGFTSAPLRPGETFTLMPRFLVPRAADHLTFTYAPVVQRPDVLLEFKVR